MKSVEELRRLVERTATDEVYGRLQTTCQSQIAAAMMRVYTVVCETLDGLVDAGDISEHNVSVTSPDASGRIVMQSVPRRSVPGDSTPEGDIIISSSGRGVGIVLKRKPVVTPWSQMSFPWIVVNVLVTHDGTSGDVHFSSIIVDTSY